MAEYPTQQNGGPRRGRSQTAYHFHREASGTPIPSNPSVRYSLLDCFEEENGHLMILETTSEYHRQVGLSYSHSPTSN
jgi:hypothetical protein